jgi:hypothetical protein
VTPHRRVALEPTNTIGQRDPATRTLNRHPPRPLRDTHDEKQGRTTVTARYRFEADAVVDPLRIRRPLLAQSPDELTLTHGG